MNGRIVLAILLAVSLYAAYSWYSTSNEGFDINSQTYQHALPHIAPIEAPTDRIIEPSGSNAPSQRPSRSMPPVIVQDERAFDPQEQYHESAELPERLRHPERLYSPGIVNEGVTDAVAAGTANYASQVTQDAAQIFGPEFAQNGGVFMNGIMANDTQLDMGYSAV